MVIALGGSDPLLPCQKSGQRVSGIRPLRACSHRTCQAWSSDSSCARALQSPSSSTTSPSSSLTLGTSSSCFPLLQEQPFPPNYIHVLDLFSVSDVWGSLLAQLFFCLFKKIIRTFPLRRSLSPETKLIVRDRLNWPQV